MFPKKRFGRVANYWTIIGPAAGLWEVSRCLSGLESANTIQEIKCGILGFIVTL